jgi:hypothetical protein
MHPRQEISCNNNGNRNSEEFKMGVPVDAQSIDPKVAAVKGQNIGAGGFGVHGACDSGHGVHGESKTSKGVVGESQGFHGVFGKSRDNVGVAAESQNAEAMNAVSHSSKHSALVAINDAGGEGVLGRSGPNVGVLGQSSSGRGVHGVSNTNFGVSGLSNRFPGVSGTSLDGRGTEGFSTNREGVAGISKKSTGVFGSSEASGTGVIGLSVSGIGVHGKGGKLAGFFEGNIEVTGNIDVTGKGSDIRLTNGDCAEDFDVSGSNRAEPGTVMILGDEGALFESQQAYDKRVAGVISGAGDYKPAIVLDAGKKSGNRQAIALMGKVFCKVDAQFGTIQVGDLLTTSPTAGHAMVASEPIRAFGTIIGKALRPLVSGTGLIPILVTLQ